MVAPIDVRRQLAYPIGRVLLRSSRLCVLNTEKHLLDEELGDDVGHTSMMLPLSNTA